jgi:ketopantoate reductase
MNVDNTRLLIIGAGVNGSVCASGLNKSGIDVTVLARGKHYDELRDKGIIIENPFRNRRGMTTPGSNGWSRFFAARALTRERLQKAWTSR